MIKQVTVTNLIMPPLGDPILTRCSRPYMTLHWHFWFVLRSAARVLSSWQSRRCGIGDRAWDHQLWASAIWALPMASYGILWHPMASYGLAFAMFFCHVTFDSVMFFVAVVCVCASENPTSLLVLGAWNIPAARRAPTSSPVWDAVACDINYTIYTNLY